MIDPVVFIEPMNDHDTALAIVRIVIGVFFAISGFHKLFNPARHATLVKTLEELNIPFIKFNQWWVPGVEFVAGIAVAVGVFTVPSALMLGAICLVALCTDGIKRVKSWKPINKADFVDSVLYLPEVLLGVLALVVILAGPDRYTVDFVARVAGLF